MALSDSEVQKVVEEAIEINGWKSDDMIGLLAECEMALNNNEGRIEQLKARGLRKLYYIITGINKKNKIKIQELWKRKSPKGKVKGIRGNRV